MFFVVAAASLLLLLLRKMFWQRSTPTVLGRHCYITGGSKGTGKALAIQLAILGANITIVARNVKDLEGAVEEIKVRRAVVHFAHPVYSNQHRLHDAPIHKK
jgi:3-dehydrosphinganine reductase